MSIDFIGPPPVAKNTKHVRIARELMSHPDVWGVIQRPATIERASSAAQAIRTARLVAYEPAGAFEAVARTIDEGNGPEHRVYARFVGNAA